MDLRLLIFLFIYSTFNIVDMSAQKLKGEYRLQGIPETASAFHFTPDGKFEFFFIYGAVDRTATGTYTIAGDTIKLQSDKIPGNDFPVKREDKKGNKYTVKVSDANVLLLANVVALYYINGSEQRAYADNDGLITIDAPHVDKIYLVHQLFPDIPSLIKDESNANNYFEVGLSPTLVNVSFKGIDFVQDGNTISCLPNYVIPFHTIRYVKN
jgi:hypothetical protein